MLLFYAFFVISMIVCVIVLFYRQTLVKHIWWGTSRNASVFDFNFELLVIHSALWESEAQTIHIVRRKSNWIEEKIKSF